MSDTPAAFAAALSTHADTAQAVDDVAARLAQQLPGPPDLLMVFVAPQHGPDYQPLLDRLIDRLAPATLLGCTGESLVGDGREVEQSPALSVWAACLPGVTLHPMHLAFERTPDGGTFSGWPDELPAEWPPEAALLLLGEPFSFPADALLERINQGHPGIPVLGGMASGGYQPGSNHVFLNNRLYDQGAVAVWLAGAVRVHAVVSQGCRPIGEPAVVTRAERNLIQQLGGRPALERLAELFATLPPAEQELLRNGLHVGRVLNEYQDQFERGDFLVRNCVGIDRESGAIAIGDWVRAGQTVQFHVRDAASADEDLRLVLQASAECCPHPAAALLFTCNGRGTRLFDQPDHDAQTVVDILGPLPTAGFFAQGEIGPVAGSNFLHGFTASVALFEPIARDQAPAAS